MRSHQLGVTLCYASVIISVGNGLDAISAPSHYQNQYWVIIKTLWPTCSHCISMTWFHWQTCVFKLYYQSCHQLPQSPVVAMTMWPHSLQSSLMTIGPSLPACTVPLINELPTSGQYSTISPISSVLTSPSCGLPPFLLAPLFCCNNRPAVAPLLQEAGRAPVSGAPAGGTKNNWHLGCGLLRQGLAGGLLPGSTTATRSTAKSGTRWRPARR